MKHLTQEEAKALTMTKTELFISWIKDLPINESILVTLPKDTGQQTFRTTINRHYKGDRSFSMKKTEKGIVVTRIK